MDGVTIAALALTAVVSVALLAAFLLSARVSLVWSLVSLLQAFHPLPPFVPLAIGPATMAATLARTARHSALLLRNGTTLSLVILLVTYVVATPISPSPYLAASNALKLLAILAAVVMTSTLATVHNIDILRLTLNALSPFAILQAVSTIAFRLNPSLEEFYFGTRIFRFMLGDTVANTISDEWFNILEPFKSGGLFFHNANRASMVMAAIGLLYAAVWLQHRRTSHLLLAALSLTGTMFAGSKTATVLAAILLPLSLLLPGLIRRGRSIPNAIFAWSILAGILAVAGVLASKVGEVIQGADRAVGQREILFTAARDYFERSPITGLGFGGWYENWSQDALSYGFNRPTLPPHNFIISEWANTGMIGATIVAIILIRLVVDFTQMVKHAPTARSSYCYSAQLMALMWIVLHGMFDATEFYGSDNTIPLFALLVTQTVVFRNKRNNTEATFQRSAAG